MSLVAQWLRDTNQPKLTDEALIEKVIESFPQYAAIRDVWPAGHVVMTHDYAYGMFFIADGQVEVTVLDDDKKPTGAVMTLGAGKFVGEMGYLQGVKRCAIVTTKVDTTVYLLPNDAFIKLVESLPMWSMVLLDSLIDRVREMNAKVAAMK